MCTAGGLLEHLVIDLYEHGVLEVSDVQGVQAWLRALLEAGYEFPRFHARSPAHGVLSPSRPAAIPAHVSVHINEGLSSSIPLWHALHAAQYASVSDHVEPGTGDTASLPSSAFPMLTRSSSLYRGSADPPFAGFLSYSSFLDVWQEIDNAFDDKGMRTGSADTLVSPHALAVVFQHDNAFVCPAMVKAWLDSSDTCMAGAGGTSIPHMDSWGDHGWVWLHLPDTIRASNQFVARNVSCLPESLCGRPAMFGPDSFYSGSSNAIAVRLPFKRIDCTERVQKLVSMLHQARADGLFAEIAVPTVAKCAVGETGLPWNLETYWGGLRNNNSWLAQYFIDRGTKGSLWSTFHPLTLAAPDAVAAADTLRDLVWARPIENHTNASPTAGSMAPLTQRPPLLLLRAETRERADLGILKWPWDRSSQWARLHGVPTVNYINTELPPWWAKVAALQRHLEDAEIVLFLDTDAVLASLGCGVVEVQALLEGGVELITAPDPDIWSGASGFNAGIIIIKSSPLMRQMVDFWMSLYNRTTWTRTAPHAVDHCPDEWSTTTRWAGPDFEQGSFVRSILHNTTYAGVHRRLSWEVLQQYSSSIRSNVTFTYHLASFLKTRTMHLLKRSVEDGTYNETCEFDVARALSVPLLEKHKQL